MATNRKQVLLQILLDVLTTDSIMENEIFSSDFQPYIIDAAVNQVNRRKRPLLGTARIENYVEEIVPTYSDPLFRAHFRMTRTSFQELLELIGPHSVERTTSLSKRTLACLWTLSNQESFRGVADRFGLSKGSLHYYLMNFSRLMTNNAILSQLISWPKTERELKIIADNFSEIAGFPNVVGAIDGSYIPIQGPLEFRDSYICRKGFPAMHLQGVCDSNLKFLDVFCAYPGSVHDARVFRNSPLFEMLQSNPLSEKHHLIGDSAYGLSIAVMVPFRDDGHLTEEQKKYNTSLSSTRATIERAFGLLKGKFRRLKFLDMRRVEDIPYVIVTCCVLHNFIIIRESFEEEDILLEGLPSEDADNDSESASPKFAFEKRQDIMYMLC